MGCKVVCIVQVLNKKTNQLANNKMQKLINIRAMGRLSNAVNLNPNPVKLPVLDEYLEAPLMLK